MTFQDLFFKKIAFVGVSNIRPWLYHHVGKAKGLLLLCGDPEMN